jgi:uncharacterized protein (TIGR02246 family)
MLLLCSTLAAGCKSSATSDDADVAAVRATVQRIIAADNARDIEAAVGCYTEDAQWFPPNTEPLVGRSELRTSYTNLFEDWVPEMVVVSDETWVRDDIAVDRGRTMGRLVSRKGKPTRTVDDTYMMWLRRENGEWRIARLMWSPNQPAN